MAVSDLPPARRTLGLVGGLGPESTIDYYRRILEAWQQEEPGTAPSIVIDSLDVQRALHLVATDRGELARYLLHSLHRLAGAGADFAAISANTPHVVFDELTARSPLPLLSIVEVSAEEARRRGFTRLGLLGTRFTMEAPLYPPVLARLGIAVVTPEAAERTWVHDCYIGQLLKGEFREETRREFISLVDRLRRDERIDGVILGGTELPLLLPGPAIAEVPVLDTTALHVAAIVERLRRPVAPGGLRVEGLAPLVQVFDMPRSVAFYRDALGFALVAQSEPGDSFDWCLLRLNGAELMLNTAYERDSRPPAPDPARIRAHEDAAIYFGCRDVDAAYAHLRGKGVAVSPPTIAPYGMKQLYLRDPDGYVLCFQWPAQEAP